MAARLPDRQKAKSTYRFQESIDRFPGLSHSDLLGSRRDFCLRHPLYPAF
jgi:hypothetical protein